MKRPKKPFRIIRGAAADYASEKFAIVEERDAAGKRYAVEDGEPVLLELWAEDHVQDELNQGWAVDDVAYPTEDVPDPRPRTEAGMLAVGTNVDVGWNIEVWGFPTPVFTAGGSGFHVGTLAQVERVTGFLSVKVTFEDGREVWAVPTAVVRLNEEI